jgi:hypothetical protein
MKRRLAITISKEDPRNIIAKPDWPDEYHRMDKALQNRLSSFAAVVSFILNVEDLFPYHLSLEGSRSEFKKGMEKLLADFRIDPADRRGTAARDVQER